MSKMGLHDPFGHLKQKLWPKEGSGVATPLWPSVGVKPNTPKVGDLESSGTPECLEFDSKAQNTLLSQVMFKRT
jgi:hypothetical protein